MRRAARRSKFHALPTMVNGIRFDSKREAARYRELLLLQKAGEIWNLELQPKFPLTVKGVKLGEYRGDFLYFERSDLAAVGDRKGTRRVVEDVKGFKTPMYRWKKRHVLAEHGVIVQEIA